MTADDGEACADVVKWRRKRLKSSGKQSMTPRKSSKDFVTAWNDPVSTQDRTMSIGNGAMSGGDGAMSGGIELISARSHAVRTWGR